jgi:hypothetical protein
MSKTEKKRGRPEIGIVSKWRIASMVSDEQKKPFEERISVKELASKIQKAIRNGGEEPPELSTLEKKIYEYKNKVAPEDEPWSIGTLTNFPISPEALPKVLKEYRHKIKEGTKLTIREAKWVARLSTIKSSKVLLGVKSQPKGRPNLQLKPEFLPYVVARTELLYELARKSPDFEIFDKLLAGLPGQSDNWQIPMAATLSVVGLLKDDPTKRGQDKRMGKQKRGET